MKVLRNIAIAGVENAKHSRGHHDSFNFLFMNVSRTGGFRRHPVKRAMIRERGKMNVKHKIVVQLYGNFKCAFIQVDNSKFCRIDFALLETDSVAMVVSTFL